MQLIFMYEHLVIGFKSLTRSEEMQSIHRADPFVTTLVLISTLGLFADDYSECWEFAGPFCT